MWWEQPDLIQNTLTAIYVAILVVVAVYGLHRYVLVYLYVKYRNQIYQPKNKFENLPRVTVQLPMFKEDLVAERIIRATCQIDYPLERLEIQVLDDSTDHSAEIARKSVEEWAAKGYPIKYVHRVNRVGYKAGALAEAHWPRRSRRRRASLLPSSTLTSSPRATSSRTSSRTSPMTRSEWCRSAGTT